MAETKRQRYTKLFAQLATERSSFESHWQEVANFIYPRGVRLSNSDTNRGYKKNQFIVDGTGTRAARTLEAGLMSGMTSPARPWFRLGTMDSDLAKFGPVKRWLEDVRVTLASRLLQSNFYKAIAPLYRRAGVLGTGAFGMFEDHETLFHFQGFPLREYYLATDHKDRVRVFAREFRMTVRQCVLAFGTMVDGKPDWSNFSVTVKNAWERGDTESPVDICHVIEPNLDYAPGSLYAKTSKPFTDCYYEKGNGAAEERYLRESGFDEFPIMAFRWEIDAGDVYGTDCPGMTALADVKQLQTGEKISIAAVDKMVRPPMLAPSSLMATRLSQLPGDISYADELPNQPIRPLIDTSQFRVDLLEQKNDRIRASIDESFFVDLFRLMSSLDPKDVTATAINELKEEKLLLLGPVYGQADQDVFKPGIDRAFAMCYRAGELPPPPPEIEGQVLEVEYISALAQALKAIGRSGVDAWTGFALQVVAPVVPDVVDKIDTDVLIERYADMTGVPPDLVRDDDQVAQLRQQRADLQKAQAAAQTIEQSAGAAKDLSDAKLDDNNALTAMLNAGAGGASGLPAGVNG